MKTIEGKFGTATAYDLETLTRKHGPAATLASYNLPLPWANAAWTSYEIGVQHLRIVPGKPDPKFNLHGATHEVAVFALHPNHAFHPCRLPVRLSSTNFVGQFVAESDAEAVARIEESVKDCVNGDLSPDTDFTQHWIARFGDSNIKGDPKTAGQTIITIGNESITFDPAPLTKKPKDTLCRFCGMPAVAVHVVGTDACLRCAVVHQDKIDVTKTLIYKLMKQHVTRK